MEEPLAGPPSTVHIPHDDHRFEYVGSLSDGRQFMAFVTGAFPDGAKLRSDTDEWRKVKSWSAVLHLFDVAGNHLRSEVRLGGYDIEGAVAHEKAQSECDRLLAQLGPGEPEFGDIWVRQFSQTINGVTYSLLYQAYRAEDDGPMIEFVMLEPGNIMFHPPWDSGNYST